MKEGNRSLRSIYNDIVEEMARINAPGASYEELFAGSLPRLIATSSGASLQITERLDDLIAEVADHQYGGSDQRETHTVEEYREIVRRSFGDPLAQLDLSRPHNESASDLAEEMPTRISGNFVSGVREFAFSCRLFEEGSFEPFTIGPVTFAGRSAWIDRSVRAGLMSSDVAERARRLLNGEELEPLSNAAKMYEDILYDLLLHPRRNICTVEVRSLGKSTGQKRAVETANLAITTLSLFMGSASQFRRSAFLAYDTTPHLKKAMSFVQGAWTIPGFAISHFPAPPLDAEMFTAFLTEHRPELDVAGEALRYGIASDDDLRRLAVSRAIRTSLMWFHRGCVDEDDRVAIIFLSSALDALTKKGKAGGITRLVCQTFQKEPTDTLQESGPPIKKLIEDIYNAGRSRLIHGSSDDMNKDWSSMRANAEQIAKSCLLGALFYFADNAQSDDLEALSRADVTSPAEEVRSPV